MSRPRPTVRRCLASEYYGQLRTLLRSLMLVLRGSKATTDTGQTRKDLENRCSTGFVWDSSGVVIHTSVSYFTKSS